MHVSCLFGGIDSNMALRGYSARSMTGEEKPLEGQNHLATLNNLPELLDSVT
jgi:hypothetical protein